MKKTRMPRFEKSISRLVVTALGSGYCPLAPGTAGSLLAVLLYAAGMGQWPLWLFATTIAATFALGLYYIRIYEAETGRHDDGRIVIDEVVGQWLTLFSLPSSWLALSLAFLAFRLCDILKPYPANYFDRQPGAAAVLLDDLFAGLWAALLVQLALWVWR